MLTALDKLLSSYNSEDVAYRAKFKDADTSVCEKTTDKYFLFIPSKDEAKKNIVRFVKPSKLNGHLGD